MKTVIQRAGKTALYVGGQLISQIPRGLVVYIGVKAGDTKMQAEQTAKKIAGLRIFEDENGKMNLSVGAVGGEILLVSQFTLYGDLSRGYRPSFSTAERPELAKPLYEYTAECLRGYGITVKTGIFGADMKIEQYNDGPVSVIYEV